LSSVFCDQHQMVFQAVDAMMMRFHCIDTKLYFSKD
jgi:stress-induced morphogen